MGDFCLSSDIIQPPEHAGLVDANQSRIERLERRLSEVVDALNHLTVSKDFRDSGSPDLSGVKFHHGHDRTLRANYVRTVIRQRTLRHDYFAGLFSDPAWDMMLDLYLAHLQQNKVSVSSLCIASRVPATTALRWIKVLTDEGLFVREPDRSDTRRIFVVAHETLINCLTSYFDKISGFSFINA